MAVFSSVISNYKIRNSVTTLEFLRMVSTVPVIHVNTSLTLKKIFRES